MLPRLVATRFEEVITEGRTHPVVLACRPLDAAVPSSSMLCKAIGCPEVRSTWQLVAEVVGNATARRIGVATPLPCVVEISDPAARMVNDGLRRLGLGFTISAGFAAGCEFLAGIAPWTIDQILTPDLRSQAGRLFAFDQLSQNPDRRRTKVNCGLTKNGLIAFDFELCFAHCFISLIGQTPVNPWEPSNAMVAKDHLFYGDVKMSPPTEDAVRDMAQALSPEWWAELRACLPAAWHADADHIGKELLAIHTHATAFAKDVIQRCLL